MQKGDLQAKSAALKFPGYRGQNRIFSQGFKNPPSKLRPVCLNANPLI